MTEDDVSDLHRERKCVWGKTYLPPQTELLE